MLSWRRGGARGPHVQSWAPSGDSSAPRPGKGGRAWRCLAALDLPGPLRSLVLPPCAPCSFLVAGKTPETSV